MTDSKLVGLLEDDEDQSRLLEAWLVQAGYTVRCYPSATEFRRRQGAASIDLLILDWNLPEESGLSVLRALRDAGSILPVLFLTARNDEADIVAGLREGADDYVVKPAKQGELLARVEVLLRRTHLQMEAGADEKTPNPTGSTWRAVAWKWQAGDRAHRSRVRPRAVLFRRRGRVVSRETLLEKHLEHPRRRGHAHRRYPRQPPAQEAPAVRRARLEAQRRVPARLSPGAHLTVAAVLPDEVLDTFGRLLEGARAAGDPEPTAMTLATKDPDGRLSARTVLLKAFDARGFVFYTNTLSRKGRALAAHPHAALLFHWKTLRDGCRCASKGRWSRWRPPKPMPTLPAARAKARSGPGPRSSPSRWPTGKPSRRATPRSRLAMRGRLCRGRRTGPATAWCRRPSSSGTARGSGCTIATPIAASMASGRAGCCIPEPAYLRENSRDNGLRSSFFA